MKIAPTINDKIIAATGPIIFIKYFLIGASPRPPSVVFPSPKERG
jgi:hypothetical protein